MYTNFGHNKPKNKERSTGKSLLYRKIQLIGRIFLLGNDQIAHLSIGSTPSAKHDRHQRASLIDVVVHMNFVLFRMLAAQPAGILDQSALEGERHRQEQGVKARKIVAFADKGCSREQNEPFAARGLAFDCFMQGLSLAFTHAALQAKHGGGIGATEQLFSNPAP